MEEKPETNAGKLYRLVTQFTYRAFGSTAMHHITNSMGVAGYFSLAGMDITTFTELRDRVSMFQDDVIEQARALDSREVKLSDSLEDELNSMMAADESLGEALSENRPAIDKPTLAGLVKEGTELWQVQNGILGTLGLRLRGEIRRLYNKCVKLGLENLNKVPAEDREDVKQHLLRTRAFYRAIANLGYSFDPSITGVGEYLFDPNVPSRRQSKPSKVLVIATNADAPVDFLATYLGEAYDVKAVPSFERAKNKIESRKYSAVISGIGKQNGGSPSFDKAFEFLEYAVGKGAPVFVMTGWQIDSNEVLKRGGRGVINLPDGFSESIKEVKAAVAEQVPYFV